MSYRTVTDPTQRLRPVVIDFSSTDVEDADETERESLTPVGPQQPKRDEQQTGGDRGATRS
jgi:hypothetical protein